MYNFPPCLVLCEFSSYSNAVKKFDFEGCKIKFSPHQKYGTLSSSSDSKVSNFQISTPLTTSDSDSLGEWLMNF